MNIQNRGASTSRGDMIGQVVLSKDLIGVSTHTFKKLWRAKVLSKAENSSNVLKETNKTGGLANPSSFASPSWLPARSKAILLEEDGARVELL